MCRHYAVFKSKYVPQQGGAVLRGLPLKKNNYLHSILLAQK